MASEKHSNVVLNFKMNGEVKYAETLKEINMVLATASKEYQKHILEMGKDASMTEKLMAEKKKLETQLNASAKKVEMLTKEFEALQKDSNATVDDLQKLYNKLLSAENAHAKLENAMKRVKEGLSEESIASREAREEFRELNAEIRTLEAEQKKLTSSFELQKASLSQTASEAERAELAQRQYAEQVAHTERYIQTLERQLDAARRAYGENSREVNQLETKINSAKTTLARFSTELEQVDDSAKKAEKGIDRLEAAIGGLSGVVAGVGLKKIIEEAFDVSDLDSKINIAFAVDEQSKEVAKQAIYEVQKYGVAQEEALEGVRRQWALNADAAAESNLEIVNGAAAISKAYSTLDFTELIQEVNEIAQELKITDKEALNLVNNLLRIGFPPEELDIIAEYGQQLKRAGFNAKEIEAIIASASGRNWNIDSLLDGLKEGRILAAEMGAGLSEGFKEAIAEVTNNTKKMTDEQIKELEKGLRKQEDSLKKSLDRQLSNARKNYSKQEKAYQKTLDKQYKAAEKNMSKQQKELEKALAEELKAFEKLADEKIKLIDKEYTERLKLIDEEKYNAIKAVEAEIAQIEALMDADEKAAEQLENQRKRQELREQINTAKTAKERHEAQEELARFEEELRRKQIKEERQQQIELLKEQKDQIKDLYDSKKDEIQSEYDLAKEQARESIELEKEALREKQQLEKESFNERKQAYLESIRERHAEELESFREMNNTKLDQMREMHEQEMERIREINEAKVEAAKNPPDSALYKQTIAQLEAWGQAIAKGDEESTKAFKNMVKWLRDIEDKTLQNIIGIELFGTKWEDEGEHLIETLLGADEAAAQLNKRTQEIVEVVEEFDTSGLQQFNNAIMETKASLGPLLQAFADVLGAFSALAAEHPKVTAFFVAVASSIGILVGAVGSLAPAIYTMTALFGEGGKGKAIGSGVLGVIKKVIPVITNLATKVLPMLFRAFMGLTPIGKVISILIAAVPLIISNWESIVGFFQTIWESVTNVFSGAIDGITNFFTEWGPTLLTVLSGPIGLVVKFFVDNWQEIKTKTSEFFNGIVDFLKEWGPTILAVLTGPLGLFVKFIVDNWEQIKEATTKVFTVVNDFVKDVFQKIYDSTIGKAIEIKDGLAQRFEDAKNAVITPIQNMYDRVVEIFENLKKTIGRVWGGVTDVIKAPINAMIELINEFIQGINSIEAPDWVPVIGGKNINIPEIPKLKMSTQDVSVQWFAKGGIMTRPTYFGASGNTLYGGGEAGPEAILPLNDTTLGKLGQMIAKNIDTKGLSGGFLIEVPVNLDGETIARVTAPFTARELGNIQRKRSRAGGKD